MDYNELLKRYGIATTPSKENELEVEQNPTPVLEDKNKFNQLSDFLRNSGIVKNQKSENIQPERKPASLDLTPLPEDDVVPPSSMTVKPISTSKPMAMNTSKPQEMVKEESKPIDNQTPEQKAPETDEELEAARKRDMIKTLLAGANKASKSIYEAFTNRPQSDKSSMDYTGDEISKLLQQRRAKKEQEILSQREEFNKQMNDPNNPLAVAYRKKLGEYLGDVPGNASIAQLKEIGFDVDSLEKAKIQREAQLARNKEIDLEKALARQERQSEREWRHSQSEAQLQEKKDKEARLSDKQLENINEYDESIDKMKASLDKLGNKKEWTGPIDARIPDMMVGGDQVAFRASVGRMQDAYRKLITGAGASNQELARLESRLPQPTDTYENFQAKAKDFINEIERARATHLNTYAKSGKNVKELVGKYQDIKKSEAPNAVKMMSPDGKIKLVPADMVEKAKKAGGKLVEE